MNVKCTMHGACCMSHVTLQSTNRQFKALKNSFPSFKMGRFSYDEALWKWSRIYSYIYISVVLSWKWQYQNTIFCRSIFLSRWWCEAERAGPRYVALPSCFPLESRENNNREKSERYGRVRAFPSPSLLTGNGKQTANASISSWPNSPYLHGNDRQHR